MCNCNYKGNLTPHSTNILLSNKLFIHRSIEILNYYYGIIYNHNLSPIIERVGRRRGGKKVVQSQIKIVSKDGNKHRQDQNVINLNYCYPTSSISGN